MTLYGLRLKRTGGLLYTDPAEATVYGTVEQPFTEYPDNESTIWLTPDKSRAERFRLGFKNYSIYYRDPVQNSFTPDELEVVEVELRILAIEGEE